MSLFKTLTTRHLASDHPGAGALRRRAQRAGFALGDLLSSARRAMGFDRSDPEGCADTELLRLLSPSSLAHPTDADRRMQPEIDVGTLGATPVDVRLPDGSALREPPIQLRLDPAIAVFFKGARAQQGARSEPAALPRVADGPALAAAAPNSTDPAEQPNAGPLGDGPQSAVQQESPAPVLAETGAELDSRPNRTIIRQFLLWARTAP